MPRPRIPDRRHRILAAARELALTRSWPRTTVADIAELAGVGKGAVYLEFPSRDAILDAVLTTAMRDLTAAVHRRCRAHEGLLDLPAVYRIGIEELLAEPLLRAVQLGDEDVLGAHVHTVDPARYRTRMDWLGQYVAALQDAGVLRKDVDREVLGQVLGTFTLGLLSAPAVLGDLDEQRLRESVALFADLVGRGLETDAEADPVAARAAQQHMLDQLTAQLETQEHS
ncbi:TetR/AcrR family transcriptional regulator [Brachybacterium paraconglomeratum]|uniref:TetR/AcrR family transcriptional regulator n=1 Tax=Brachybacterium paraconglomeratum TaxID=173362 RepID=UPI003F7BD562